MCIGQHTEENQFMYTLISSSRKSGMQNTLVDSLEGLIILSLPKVLLKLRCLSLQTYLCFQHYVWDKFLPSTKFICCNPNSKYFVVQYPLESTEGFFSKPP